MKQILQKKVLKLDGSEKYELVTVEKTKKPNFSSKIIPAVELGFAIALPITGGALFGLWIDKKRATAPIFTLICLLIGVFLAFANLLKLVKDFSNNHK